MAAEFGNVYLILELLRCGADLESRNIYRRPLEIALFLGNTDAANVLVWADTIFEEKMAKLEELNDSENKKSE